MSTQTSTASKIATMTAALDYLTANYATLDISVIRSTRSSAMNMGRAILNSEATERADFMQAYDLIIELDRVGY